jgi:hypothetical protein
MVVSVVDPVPPRSLLQRQLRLEARVGIEPTRMCLMFEALRPVCTISAPDHETLFAVVALDSVYPYWFTSLPWRRLLQRYLLRPRPGRLR